MIKSLKEMIERCVDSYDESNLTKWILDWPGQVIKIF